MYKMFDIVTIDHKNDMYLILSDTIQVPYFEDGCASKYATTPLEIQNPSEWKHFFPGRIAMNLLNQEYHVIAEGQIRNTLDDHLDSSIPFDHASSRLRMILGLLDLSDHLSDKKPGTIRKNLGL